MMAADESRDNNIDVEETPEVEIEKLVTNAESS